MIEKVKDLLKKGFEVGEIAFSLGCSCNIVERVKERMVERGELTVDKQ